MASLSKKLESLALKVARGITFPRNAYRSEMLTTYLNNQTGEIELSPIEPGEFGIESL